MTHDPSSNGKNHGSLVPISSLHLDGQAATRTIRDGYDIHFSEEFSLAQAVPLSFFSKANLHSPKLSRKYLRPVSSRGYWPNGRKKWFCSLMFHYELLVPKDCLLLDTQGSGASYIHYDIAGVRIINNTCGGSMGDHQDERIKHCMKVTKKDFDALCSTATAPTKTVYEGPSEFGLDFDPVAILMIQKYANGQTNYSKTYKRYDRFRPPQSGLLRTLLECSFYPSRENSDTIRRGFMAGFYDGRDMDIYMDYLQWRDLYRRDQFSSVPMEIYEAFTDLRSWKQ